MKRKRLIILGLITMIAAILRFMSLNAFPVSLNWDEVSHGYNAYSLIKTGRDEWGKTLPLIFRAFGDYKLPVYIYLTTIPVFFFGLSAFSVRFMSALFGVLAVPGIYFLVDILFPQKKIKLGNAHISFAFASALLLSLLPWHIFISRPALEANVSLTLLIWGAYFLIGFVRHCDKPKGATSPKYFSLLPSMVMLGLALHTYNTARVYVPTLLLASLIIFRKKLINCLKNNPHFFFHYKNIIGLIFIILCGLVVVFQVFLGEGTARYNKLKILSDSAIYQIGENRTNSSLSPQVARFVYNRPVYFTTTFIKNYINYFSPAFFYQKWGSQFQFAIPGVGLLSLPVYLLFIIGFIRTLFYRKDEYGIFVVLSLLLAPVAAALTADPPQALRPNPMIPFIVILAVVGINEISLRLPQFLKGITLFFVLAWILASDYSYLRNYFGHYAGKYSQSWQYGYRQVMEYVASHGSEYEKIFITKKYGEPHIFYAFYTSQNPGYLQSGGDNVRFEKSDWFWTDRVKNVYFVNDWQTPTTSIDHLHLESGEDVSTAHSLFITTPDHIPVNAHIIETIKFLDGSPAFIITSIP